MFINCDDCWGVIGADDEVTAAEKIELNPIGIVKTEIVGKETEDAVSEIIMNKDLTEGLDGIKDFSHLFVLYWMNRISNIDRAMMKIHPRGRVDLPLVGIFASRTPCRPNPIGLTLVELLKVEGNVITVRGLDALDESPVLDIKPFAFWDIAGNVKVPEWWMRMKKERSGKTRVSK